MTDGKSRKAVSVDTERYPHTLFNTGAWALIDEIEEDIAGHGFAYLGSILFSAFMIEAYLNYLGSLKLESSWSQVERALSPEAKLRLLAGMIGLHLDFGKPPFQTFKELFKLRNAISHAKPELIHTPEIDWPEDEVAPYIPLTGKSLFYEPPSREKARRILEYAEQIIETLHSKANIEDYPVWPSSETSTWWVSHE